ncbi:MAG: thymidylate synthase [Acidimicrobiales bacterium]
MPPESSEPLGRVVRAPSLGRGWLEAVGAILAEGRATSYDGAPIVELELLDLVVEAPATPDALIERFGDPERLLWMKANFNDRAGVAELGGAASYATRLYDYEGTGKDQVAWVTDKLRNDLLSRSAIITTLQPLSDSTYIPCVSLLQFWMPDEYLEMVVTAHSIDFGTKGYANLIELAQIQERVGASLAAPIGRLILRTSSAHLFERDLETLRSVLARSKAL